VRALLAQNIPQYTVISFAKACVVQLQSVNAFVEQQADNIRNSGRFRNIYNFHHVELATQDG
jgi:hypothetical protein